MLGLRPEATGADGGVGAPLSVPDAIADVEALLQRVLEARLDAARGTDAVCARDVAGRVAALARGGGKRLRTAFAWCGWRAAGGRGDSTALLCTGVALELVQVCALVHDDVMDGSPLRRGAPAVHVDLARQHRAAGMTGPAESFATSAAVLVGDLALVWADDLLTEAALGSPHGPRLHREWRAMREEMVAGQYRDIHAEASGSPGTDEALTIAELKGARYTVARPLTLGASLAGADEPTLGALRAAGRCAGLAFQLRDDLLGAFGDPAVTGKPAGDDLRAGKPTYLLAVAARLAEAGGDEEAAAVLAAAGGPDHSVARTRAVLERIGARAAVQAKIAELVAESLRHFRTSGAAPDVRQEFAAVAERATGVAAGRSEEAV
ncbi:polyprenyl synthetase family protein [Streptomyces sp. SCSIO ZS0520]|uniref:polyprenyl synthetase family protein n=1 Tax=Streptomyces sp. SCSIO ZS0520 TaxID=2892996 RepID=UPI0021D92E04|nr:polyprenyl synthetase family protein [Streptomyces sp. SCSIO ZS0520]